MLKKKLIKSQKYVKGDMLLIQDADSNIIKDLIKI